MNITLLDHYPPWVWLTMLVAVGAYVVNYACIIRRSALDRTWGMPMPALAANIAHEFHHAFVVPHGGGRWVADAIWFTLDLVILWQCLRWSRDLFYREASARAVRVVMGLLIVTSWVIVAAMGVDFDDPWGLYSAWILAALTSALYIGMSVARASPAGQSVWIAGSRLVGNLGFAVLWLPYLPPTALLPVLMVLTGLLDATYVVRVWRLCRRAGITPWRRV